MTCGCSTGLLGQDWPGQLQHSPGGISTTIDNGYNRDFENNQRRHSNVITIWKNLQKVEVDG